MKQRLDESRSRQKRFAISRCADSAVLTPLFIRDYRGIISVQHVSSVRAADLGCRRVNARSVLRIVDRAYLRASLWLQSRQTRSALFPFYGAPIALPHLPCRYRRDGAGPAVISPVFLRRHRGTYHYPRCLCPIGLRDVLRSTSLLVKTLFARVLSPIIFGSARRIKRAIGPSIARASEGNVPLTVNFNQRGLFEETSCFYFFAINKIRG